MLANKDNSCSSLYVGLLLLRIHLTILIIRKKVKNTTNKSHSTQLYLRLDQEDDNSYYFYTGEHLQSILHEVDNALNSPENISLDGIDTLYNEIVAVLNTGAKLYVRSRQNTFINSGGTRS